MGWVDLSKLVKIFDDVVYSRPVFPYFRKAFSLKRRFNVAIGLAEPFAISPKDLFPQIMDALSKGRMHPMNAAALMCVNSNRHDTSLYDTPDFLKNFLALYSAETWQECCEIEGIEVGTEEFNRIRVMNDNRTKLDGVLASIENGSFTDEEKIAKKEKAIKDDQKWKLEKIKSFCWARDLERATASLGKDAITIGDVQHVLDAYNKKAAKRLDEQDQFNKKANPDIKPDLTALSKDVYLPLLRKADKEGNLSETQCGIMLMFILHAREKRNKSSESYINHPVAVSKLVGEWGEKYLGNNGLVWMAQMAALLHDGGEKTDINMDEDLQGLLPDAVIEAIKCLHKKDGETYFQYLERIADNPLASVVKLCDIYHNSADMGDNPSSKQAFVYPLAANYVEYRLNNPDKKISVADFVEEQKICSFIDFVEINEIAESGEHKGPKDNNLSKDAAKKRPASDFPHLQIALSKVKSIKEILTRVNPENAHPRREEDASLHP